VSSLAGGDQRERGKAAARLPPPAAHVIVVPMVRRLPVVQMPEGPDAEAEARPAWQWLLIAAVWLVVLFLPLSMLALWFGRPLPGLLLACALSAWAAGAVVGRFGARAKRATAPLGAALGAVILIGIAALGRAAPLVILAGALIILASVGASLAELGARYGRRLRTRR